MRSSTRVVLVVVLALAMIWALALPGVAKKAGNPGKGDKAPFTVQVDLVDSTHEYPFYWVNAVGDEFRFRVTVDGATAPLVSWTIDGVDGGPLSGSDDVYVEHAATSDTDILATFTVTDGQATVETAVTVDVAVEPDCEDVGLEKNEDGTSYSGYLNVPCRWSPTDHNRDFLPGYWDVTLTPDTGVKGNPSWGSTLRDHVPGNWCVEQLEDGSLGHQPWGRGKGEITGVFYLPVDGYCLGGGAGGEMMAVGSTSDFFLVADKIHITLEHRDGTDGTEHLGG
jgi:hypothetical protein